MESQVSGTHQKIYRRTFQHPMPHNLQWREVWSMLCAMTDASATEDDKGKTRARAGSPRSRQPIRTNFGEMGNTVLIEHAQVKHDDGNGMNALEPHTVLTCGVITKVRNNFIVAARLFDNLNLSQKYLVHLWLARAVWPHH